MQQVHQCLFCHLLTSIVPLWWPYPDKFNIEVVYLVSFIFL